MCTSKIHLEVFEAKIAEGGAALSVAFRVLRSAVKSYGLTTLLYPTTSRVPDKEPYNGFGCNGCSVEQLG